MRWRCERGRGEHGSKRYVSAEDAERHARAFDHEDAESLGGRAPLAALFPLRLLMPCG
jgi:hypothetical protein